MQANTLRPYLTCIRSTLEAALCLRNFPSQTVERHNRPEVEDRSSRELLLTPITITRTDKESTFIEPSINSTRVSIRIKQSDEVERLLAHKFAAFLQQRAEQFIILRRRPVAGYDLSFLITHAHLETMIKSKLIDFVIAFMEGAWDAAVEHAVVAQCVHIPLCCPRARTDIDKEISYMKISLNWRARVIATTFLESLARGVVSGSVGAPKLGAMTLARPPPE